MKSNRQTLIGWNELIDLPAWNVKRLRAKIDTGARSSALHVTDLRVLPDDRVAFDVVLDRKKSHRRRQVVAPVTRVSRVRSSTGKYTRRYFVKTLLRLGEVEKTIEVSLVDREEMLFRMLLGRTALSHDFLIDPGRRRLASESKPTRKKKKELT